MSLPGTGSGSGSSTTGEAPDLRVADVERSTPAGLRRIDLAGVDEVPPGTMQLVDVDGDLVLVVNLDGVVHAVQGICSHQYFELDRGFLTAGTLTCALHLSRFELDGGEPLDPPAELPLEVYPVVVEAGRILIEVPEGPLAANR